MHYRYATQTLRWQHRIYRIYRIYHTLKHVARAT